jgi:hypothetical protein
MAMMLPLAFCQLQSLRSLARQAADYLIIAISLIDGLKQWMSLIFFQHIPNPARKCKHEERVCKEGQWRGGW